MKARLFTLLSLLVFVVLLMPGKMRPSAAQSHQVGASHWPYNTALGESGGDYGHTIAMDKADSTYVVGSVTLSDFHTTLGILNAGHDGSSEASTVELREGSRLKPTSAITTIIPYGDTEYKYRVVPHGEGEGFEQPGFDDSEFSTGDAGFGIPSGDCPLNNPTDVRTTWPLETDILLRKQFNLPPGFNNLKVSVAIDNDIQVFLNGQDISGGLRVHENCATRDSFVFTAPNEVLTAGTNLLAVRGRDRGYLSYLDIQMTAEIVKLYLPLVIRHSAPTGFLPTPTPSP